MEISRLAYLNCFNMFCLSIFPTDNRNIYFSKLNIAYIISNNNIYCLLVYHFFSYFIYLFFKITFIYFNWRLITLQYCIGFAMHQHESATSIHVFPIPNPSPSSLPIPSLWVASVHQPQASSIMHLAPSVKNTKAIKSYHLNYPFLFLYISVSSMWIPFDYIL